LLGPIDGPDQPTNLFRGAAACGHGVNTYPRRRS
jgi:hypothetical protein